MTVGRHLILVLIKMSTPNEYTRVLADVMGDHISNFYATYGEEVSVWIRNPFIDDEAEESEVISIEPAEEEEQHSRKRRRHVIILSSDDYFQ